MVKFILMIIKEVLIMLKNFDRIAEKYDNSESEHLKILYYDLEKGYTGTYKSYGYYRLCTMLTGQKKVSINGEKSFTYSASEYLLLPPNSSVEMTIGSHTKAIVYEIDNRIIEKVSQQVEKTLCVERVITKKAYSEELLSVVKSLNFGMYQNDKESKFLMDLKAQELIYRLINPNNKNSVIDNQFNPAVTAKEIIMKPGNEYLSIGEISEILMMSQSNLDYYFKKEFGMSPKKFQNHVKIERAKDLLRDNNVTEVAMMLGFDNISHFIRLFKMVYGVTPKRYKI